MPLFKIIKKGETPAAAPPPPGQMPAQMPSPMPGQPATPSPYPAQAQQVHPMQPQMAHPQVPPPPAHNESPNARVEEIAEAIIDEKWSELLKDINKIVEWKETTESRLVKLEEEITNLKQNFDSLHKGILGKISEYDKNIANLGTGIKAMEKTFQNVLPTFTENVNKLSRIMGGVKPKK